MDFKNQGNYIYTINYSFIKSYIHDKNIKIAGFDLDHTLIRPKNGKTFPKSKEDTEFVFDDIIDFLNNLIIDKYVIVIFSNQHSLNDKPEKKDIVLSRINYLYSLFPKFQLMISSKDDFMRKPNIGMWEFLDNELKTHDFKIDKKNSFFVGDAAGRIKYEKLKKDFSCSDRMFASNIGISFFTPELYFRRFDIRENTENFIMINKANNLFNINENKIKQNELLIESIKQFNIILLIGPPASGKSYISKKLKSENYIVFSNDDYKTQNSTIKALKTQLEKNINSKIIIDNTNSVLKNRKLFTDIFKKKNLDYCYVYIDINKEQSLFLNNYRCKLLKQVKLSNIAIHSYYKKFEYPTHQEEYRILFKLDFIPEFDNEENKKLFYQYY